MLTREETDFLAYWKVKREGRKGSFNGFTIGIPLAVLIVLGLFLNIASGWYTRASMVLRANSSLIIVIIIAAIAIVIFITVFSVRYQWEQNEQRYQELSHKEENVSKEPL